MCVTTDSCRGRGQAACPLHPSRAVWRWCLEHRLCISGEGAWTLMPREPVSTPPLTKLPFWRTKP